MPPGAGVSQRRARPREPPSQSAVPGWPHGTAYRERRALLGLAFLPGTHHGRSRSRHDGGGRERVGEGREGVLVRVLVRVLVLVLVLVELGPQVGRGAQGGPAVSTLRGQKTRVQFLAQDVLLWKRGGGRR